MKPNLTALTVLVLTLLGPAAAFAASTPGTARMEVTINDYVGTSGQGHWTVAWVTTESGTFIKSLRKQGPSFTGSDWANHCGAWQTARNGSAAIDGYSSATATTYTGTNSPVIQQWNGLDASNNPMPDGNYKFWVQYAENQGQGPVTTSGLLWTKGPAGSTNTYANQGANFTNMKVTWTPAGGTAPSITSAAPTGTATVGVPYQFTCTASGTTPVGFTSTGLPPGLAISTAGLISGTPTAAGSFSGTITATNGTLPNATQSFAINVSVVPTTFATPTLAGNSLILSGQGPANGAYSILVSTNASDPTSQWTATATGNFNASGQFRYTNTINPAVPRQYYRVRVP